MKHFSSHFLKELDFRSQAREFGVSVWKTPSFLFVLMGLITIVVMMVIYLISREARSAEFVILSEVGVVMVIMLVGGFIIKGYEQVAMANKMKTEFVSIASHQLKTPLSEIKWITELLVSNYQSGLTAKQSEIISTIRTSAQKMIRLVNDLLDVARIEQDRFVLIKDNFDLVGLIEEVIENNAIFAQASGVKLIFKKTPEMSVFADRKRIGVVVDNLVSNAIKYIGNRGEVKIDIQKKGDRMTVCVKDNGMGIPEAQQSKVFQKFFRSDNVARFQTEGTGLGLYIAKNIVEQSGGEIWFKSQEGQGAEFCFFIPIRNAME